MRTRAKMVGIGLVVLVVAGACGGDKRSAATGDPAASIVEIRTFTFTPSPVTVRTGSAVSWTNHDDTTHTVTAGTPEGRLGVFDSGPLTKGEAFRLAFEAPGAYAYFCAVHESMRGEVQVELSHRTPHHDESNTNAMRSRRIS